MRQAAVAVVLVATMAPGWRIAGCESGRPGPRLRKMISGGLFFPSTSRRHRLVASLIVCRRCGSLRRMDPLVRITSARARAISRLNWSVGLAGVCGVIRITPRLLFARLATATTCRVPAGFCSGSFQICKMRSSTEPATEVARVN